jgi:hypothetical protein
MGEFTQTRYEKLRAQYNKMVKDGRKTVMYFEGTEYGMQFTKQLLEYLQPQFK